MPSPAATKIKKPSRQVRQCQAAHVTSSQSRNLGIIGRDWSIVLPVFVHGHDVVSDSKKGQQMLNEGVMFHVRVCEGCLDVVGALHEIRYEFPFPGLRQ